MILDVRNLTKRFGELIAVNNVSLTVNKGEVLGIIGPNGSGKTTLLNLISGIYEKSNGEIYLKGERIDHLMPNEIALKGVARTFQIPKLFRNMTVKENLLVPAKALFKSHNYYEVEKRISELLRFVGLESLKNEFAKNLSGGQPKLLEIARA
ncbi:MAG: ATP-binding cassette domain-containing protein, partial [Nitrososphaerales archaeon]